MHIHIRIRKWRPLERMYVLINFSLSDFNDSLKPIHWERSQLSTIQIRLLSWQLSIQLLVESSIQINYLGTMSLSISLATILRNLENNQFWLMTHLISQPIKTSPPSERNMIRSREQPRRKMSPSKNLNKKFKNIKHNKIHSLEWKMKAQKRLRI